MARPNYRRKNGKYAWHFCTNCPDWPTTDYTTSTTAGDPLCDHCQALEKKGNCN